MSAILNILEGVKVQAQERLKREAEIKNEQEKLEREFNKAETTGAEEDDAEETPEQLQEQLQALEKAIADVTAKLNKGAVK